MTAFLAALLAAAPHVVVVQRSLLGVPPAVASPFMAQTRDRLQTAGLRVELGQPCPRAVDCLTAAAAAQGVDVAVGVSVAALGDRYSVDLEATGHSGQKVALWTGPVAAHTTWLPPGADSFFAAIVKELKPAPEPVVSHEPAPANEPIVITEAPPPVRPNRPLFVATGAAAAVALACGLAGVVLHFQLHPAIDSSDVIPFTRAEALSRINTENALYDAALSFGLVALGLLISGVIALAVQ